VVRATIGTWGTGRRIDDLRFDVRRVLAFVPRVAIAITSGIALADTLQLGAIGHGAPSIASMIASRNSEGDGLESHVRTISPLRTAFMRLAAVWIV